MKYDVLLKGGYVVTTENTSAANLGIKDGKIAAIINGDTEVSAEKTYDVTGKYVLPGMVDVHIHGGHGDPDRETLTNATMAAAAGGITTVMDQPLSNPSTVNLKAYQDKLAAADEQCVVDFGLWGGLIPGNFEDLEDLYKAGGMAYKSFMCRCSNYAMAEDGVLLKGMRRIAKWGGLVAVHAENDTLIAQLLEDFEKEGKKGVDAFLDSHAPYTELEAIKRFIFLAEQAPGCKAHICHMSIPQGAEAIREAKMKGINISAETCPQYLGLNTDYLRKIGGIAKCDPPVRDQKLVDKLWEYVLNGTIDIICSDHSPHPFEKKDLPEEDFDKASEGVTGLQTMLPVLFTEGVHKRNISLNQLVKLTSYNPARRFGLYPEKGTMAVGTDADVIVVDMDKEWKCKAEDMYYLNKHTPFDGRKFTGKIEKTFVRGSLVYSDGKILVKPGFGNFYPMHMDK